jgi:hypothetical protein
MFNTSRASRGAGTIAKRWSAPGMGGGAQWPAKRLAAESRQSGHYTILHLFCKLAPSGNDRRGDSVGAKRPSGYDTNWP